MSRHLLPTAALLGLVSANANATTIPTNPTYTASTNIPAPVGSTGLGTFNPIGSPTGVGGIGDPTTGVGGPVSFNAPFAGTLTMTVTDGEFALAGQSVPGFCQRGLARLHAGGAVGGEYTHLRAVHGRDTGRPQQLRHQRRACFLCWPGLAPSPEQSNRDRRGELLPHRGGRHIGRRAALGRARARLARADRHLVAGATTVLAAPSNRVTSRFASYALPGNSRRTST